jgi:ribosome-associated protein YbcJ (S4-like RNA binding protein)
MQQQNNIRRGQGITLTLTPRIQTRKTRRIMPGDRVLIFDGLISQNVWIVVDEVLITNGRTKIRSGNMQFYFDSALVIAHRKGGKR